MSYRVLAIAALCLVGVCTAVEKSTFHNYHVYSVNVSSVEQLQALRQLENGEINGLDFWRSAKNVGELLIDNEQPTTRASQLSWTAYHNLETIYEWLDEQLLAYPTILTNLTVGLSYQNRTIRAVRLSHKEGNPTIFIESNIHAREWITSATATWLLNELLTSTNPDVQDLAQNINWVIVPVFNVDGFAYTHSVNRMWRKTRQPHGHLCVGADANRNFDHKWMVIGASQNICSETYAGPRAFSEPETRALANFVASFAGQIKIYFAFHSYGQYFMFPWGYTSEPIDNFEALSSVANKTKEAIAQRFGTEYRVGPSSTTIYETSGSSQDWAYGAQNIRSSYTIEFRDRNQYGFLLPANQIIPNAQETLDGLIAAVKESRVHNHL